MIEGDTKQSAKGPDGAARKDGLQQPFPGSQHVQQPSFSQGMDYGNTQVLNMEELYSSHDIHDVLRRWAGCFLEVIT
ncbi:hypothetical protein CASFOL_018107 [Castilleja foliolosa]|uniref:Uncharacterized protein n=1 Tax=Castilleja foliolosa TaxID=1961234 RepID=A0ABD3D6V8_9LAMI